MSSLQIDASMFEQVPDRLPQDLLEKCAAMSVRTNAIKDLVDSMSGRVILLMITVLFTCCEIMLLIAWKHFNHTLYCLQQQRLSKYLVEEDGGEGRGGRGAGCNSFKQK